MYFVIDANIVKGYYEETVKELTTNLTHSTIGIFQALGNECYAYLDEGGQVKAEWSSGIDPEWFQEWYSELLLEGCIYEIVVNNCPELRKRLRQKGFPDSTRDKWYIKTCSAVTDNKKIVHLISEDLDFYDPTKKNTLHGVARLNFLRKEDGPVPKILKKYNNIHVKCVANLNCIAVC